MIIIDTQCALSSGNEKSERESDSKWILRHIPESREESEHSGVS